MQYRQEWESNMEQELSKNTYVLQEDEKIGTVKIADDVVAMIAALAATEVEGIAAMNGNMANELLSRVGLRDLPKAPEWRSLIRR